MSHPAPNVDPAELAKFERLAARWWDPESEFKPLHDINPLRLGWIESRAGDLRDRRVLDVGCGGGILAESLAARGADVVGIDMGEAPLAVARLHLRESGLRVDYRRSTVEDLARAEPATFDVVCCMELIEHVPEPSSVVRACAELAKPDGHVVFSTINRNPKAYLFAVIGAEYLLRLLPRGTHEYAKFVRPAELERWGRAAGLEAGAATGMHYDPFTRSYRLGPGLDVNYLMHFRRPAGA